ncbi:hypothetical protein [Rhizobium laguerreae]|uniref:hypothetical protein n=1 Tax=Rhizobium laguerreae TaxID=1076926 RepID=UPI001C9259C7|nr:hypothetical protein [Rhizobium laguerreae]MBY3038908.1 hypothetical protein [Rhizobium laguerreae]
MNALTSTVKDFATNPFGAILIAISTAACWDLMKFLWARWFTLEKGILKKIANLQIALDRYENGTFIVDMLHGAIFVIILSAFAVILSTFQVAVRTGEIPEVYSRFIFVFVLVNFLAIYYILLNFRNYFYSLCYTTYTIKSLHKRIARIPESQRDEWTAVLNKITEKADQLKLLDKE